MQQLQFFPSRTIAFYMGRAFLLRTLAILAALVIILQTLDLLGESGDILAAPGNGQAALWQYVALRMPQIVARFLPFSVLLSTLLTLATLNQNSEIIAMKAAGVSAHQILAPLVVASIAVAGVSFAFNERVVTKATAALDAWQSVDYGAPPRAGGGISNIWVRDGDDLIHADIVTGSRAATRLSNITIYDRDGGALKRIIDAPNATPELSGGKVVGWRLHGARMFDLATGLRGPFGNPLFGRDVTPEQFTLADVSADDRNFFSLRAAIAELDAAGRPTGALEAGLWHKLSGPMSAILMPLLAGVAAFGLARSGQLVMRAVLGMMLGFTYFVADNFSLAMGSFGAYPPLLSAWSAFLLFFLIGEAVLIRTEE
jgi:lipopolysaccharide export system permease protein